MDEQLTKKFNLHDFLIALFGLAGTGIVCVAVYYFIAISNLNLSFTVRLVFALLLGLDALGYFFAAWGIYKKISWIYPFAFALVAINILALFFDDIGLADILAALFNTLLGVLLIVDKRRILASG